MAEQQKDISMPGPNLWELGALVLTSVGHIVVELLFGGGMKGPGDAHDFGRIQDVYNIAAALGWGAYVLWRILKTPRMARAWGLQRENFLPAFKPALLFGVVGAIGLVGYGAAMGRLPLPMTFWLTFAIYPIWGIPQQFALQGLITRNLEGIVRADWGRAILAATLFSAAHFPTWWLMALVFPVGVVFSLIYIKRPNIWALGIVHGPLGALAFYCVLGEDPGSAILRALGLM